MKKLAFLLLLLGSLGIAATAQKPKSTIRFRLSDGTPLLLTINGRDYQKTGRSITVSDLPGKRQSVMVYRFRPYADGRGGKAEQLYAGTIKLERGKTYEAVVDVDRRKLRLKQVVSIAPDELPFDPRRDQTINNHTAAPAVAAEEAVSPELQQLKAAMDKQTEDGKKLYEAKKYTTSNNYSTRDVKMIASWFFFDDTRLVFVKLAYPKVQDPKAYQEIAEAFTMEKNKQEFSSFLSGK